MKILMPPWDLRHLPLRDSWKISPAATEIKQEAIQTMNTKELSRAYQLCIRYLAPRARSSYEMRKYLEKKGFDEQISLNTIAKLEQENLINDRDFASMFVEQRERFRPKSKFALAFELRQKGIEKDTIDSCIMDIDEHASALSAVQTKLKLWMGYDDEKLKKKVMNYLKNRGFSYEVSISTFSQLLSGQDNRCVALRDDVTCHD